jgi:hypothetical protein
MLHISVCYKEASFVKELHVNCMLFFISYIISVVLFPDSFSSICSLVTLLWVGLQSLNLSTR